MGSMQCFSNSNAGNRSSGTGSVINHFKENFELSGFGSSGEALVQTVKELVDNAIDACRWRTAIQDAPTVRVVLRRHPHPHALDPESGNEVENRGTSATPLELQVADNGSGLMDAAEALMLFSSTKSGHGQNADTAFARSIASLDPGDLGDPSNSGEGAGAQAGKYGLGLTLCLLYSQVTFGGCMKVTSAVVKSGRWCFTKCSLDLETGQPVVSYRRCGSKPPSWTQGCGTDIRLLVPGDEAALQYAKPRLRTFFGRLHLTADRAAGTTLTCEGCLDNLRISVPRGGKEWSPRLLRTNDDLVRAFAEGVTSMMLGIGLRISCRAGGAGKAGTCACGKTKGEGGNCCGICLFRGDRKSTDFDSSPSSLMRLGLNNVREDGEAPTSSSFSSSPLSSSSSSFGPIRKEDTAVFRCQGQGEDTGEWSITVAIALGRAEETEARDGTPEHSRPLAASSACQNEEASVPLYIHRFANGVPMLDTDTSCACALVAGVSKGGWRTLGLKISTASRVVQGEGALSVVLSEAPTPVRVKDGASWSALLGIKSVHMSVSVDSKTVPYTSLRKDAIAHKKGYVAATASAVREGLLSLSNREVGGFRSAAEAAKDMIQEELIPQMASSVAAMVEGSGDTTFQRTCLNTLGAGSEYVRRERLSDLLQEALSRNIREEQERQGRRTISTVRDVARKAREEAGTGPGDQGDQGNRPDPGHA